MEIREPKFKVGDRVYCNKFKFNAVVIGISDYSFVNDKYYYRIRYDDGDEDEMIEDMLDLYIEKPKTVWDLKNGDKCFFINSIGSMIPVKWDGTYCAIRNLGIGNVFLTKEEAEMEIERRRIETKMIRLGGRRKFNRGKDNYFIMYTRIEGLDYVNYQSMHEQGVIYFDSEEKAEEAVEIIGKDRIKKYIFRVES